MEKQGSPFGIHGISGFLIATVLLLSILVGLTTAAIITQQETAPQSYEIQNPLGIRAISKSADGSETHIVVHGAPIGGDTLHKYKFEK